MVFLTILSASPMARRIYHLRRSYASDEALARNPGYRYGSLGVPDSVHLDVRVSCRKPTHTRFDSSRESKWVPVLWSRGRWGQDLVDLA
jgi:hypothetical protein